MADRIVHVGLGKTATTSLQHKVFPRVAEHARMGYYGCNSSEAIARHRAQLYLWGESSLSSAELGSRFLVSCENLVGWDPYWWDAFAEANRSFFGADATVLLTVREPRSWLTSVYLQMCVHQGNILAPEEYFLPSSVYSPYLATPKFAVDAFGYQRLVDAYTRRFRKVVVVPMESLPRLDFVADLVDVSGVDLGPLRRDFASYRVNRAYSARAVRLTRQLDRLLRWFGLALAGTQRSSARSHLRALRSARVAAPRDSEANPSPRGKLRAAVGRAALRVASELRWRNVIQNRLDRALPYKRYELDFDGLPWIPIQALEHEYRCVTDQSEAHRARTGTVA